MTVIQSSWSARCSRGAGTFLGVGGAKERNLAWNFIFANVWHFCDHLPPRPFKKMGGKIYVWPPSFWVGSIAPPRFCAPALQSGPGLSPSAVHCSEGDYAKCVPIVTIFQYILEVYIKPEVIIWKQVADLTLNNNFRCTCGMFPLAVVPVNDNDDDDTKQVLSRIPCKHCLVTFLLFLQWYSYIARWAIRCCHYQLINFLLDAEITI